MAEVEVLTPEEEKALCEKLRRIGEAQDTEAACKMLAKSSRGIPYWVTSYQTLVRARLSKDMEYYIKISDTVKEIASQNEAVMRTLEMAIATVKGARA